MFGYQVGFNIDGEEVHKTLPGACVSIFIFAWLAVVLRFLIIQTVVQNLDRPLTTRILANYYGDDLVPFTASGGFKFAVGLSSVQNF